MMFLVVGLFFSDREHLGVIFEHFSMEKEGT